jgi:dihydrofolate reductase
MARPLGDGGGRLFKWLRTGEEGADGKGANGSGDCFTIASHNAEMREEMRTSVGAVVAGRRMYDISDGWGGSFPIPGIPVFVLTHEVPVRMPEGDTWFTFVTGGIESAIRKAQAAAGEKSVGLGGAKTTQQGLAAGLVDELQIHLVPLLLGKGVRLFDQVGGRTIELEKTSVVDAAGVTHLKYRVVK